MCDKKRWLFHVSAHGPFISTSSIVAGNGGMNFDLMRFARVRRPSQLGSSSESLQISSSTTLSKTRRTGTVGSVAIFSRIFFRTTPLLAALLSGWWLCWSTQLTEHKFTMYAYLWNVMLELHIIFKRKLYVITCSTNSNVLTLQSVGFDVCSTKLDLCRPT